MICCAASLLNYSSQHRRESLHRWYVRTSYFSWHFYIPEAMVFHKVKAPAHGSLELRAIGHVGLPGNLLVQSFCFLLYHGTINRHIMPVLPVHIPCEHPLSGFKNRVPLLKVCHMVALAGLSLTTSLILSRLFKTTLIIDLVTPYFQARLLSLYCLNDIKLLAVQNLGARVMKPFLVVNKVRLVRSSKASQITVGGQ